MGQNKDEFRPWKQLKRSRIWQIYHGRRYDQWDEAERLLVKLLKKVNNHSVWRTLFGGGKGQEDVAGIQSRSVHAQIYFALL